MVATRSTTSREPSEPPTSTDDGVIRSHVLLSGNFRNSDFIPAVLDMASPAVAVELWLSTLGYDKQTADMLLHELDAGRIGRVTLLGSVYFASRAPASSFGAGLPQNWSDEEALALAGRNDCKTMAFVMSDGRHLAIESSANLRSCKMLELATVTSDAGLCNFHRTWIDDLFEKARTT